MRWQVVLLVLAMAACRQMGGPDASAGDLREWVLPTGKPPTKAEFAAIVAACQDRGETAGPLAGLRPCLADYGVRRVP